MSNLPNVNPQREPEIWKSLAELDFPNYDVSSHGKIRNNKTGRIMKHSISRSNRFKVGIVDKNGKKSTKMIHDFVIKIFVSPRPNDQHTVDHIDRDPSNNYYKNLRWATSDVQLENRSLSGTKAGRPVNQYDLNGIFIREWKSITEVRDTLQTSENISEVCTGRRNSSNGYIWKYVDDVKIIEGEIWKNIPYLEYGNIQVSNIGRVRLITGRITYGQNLEDYLHVYLKRIDNGIIKNHSVHRLVVAAFIGINEDLFVNHKNGIRSDNRLENLEYVTASQNSIHAYETGLSNPYCRPVYKINPLTKEVTKYPSVKIAKEQTGISVSNILNICNGKVKYIKRNRYLWRYADDTIDVDAAIAAMPANIIQTPTVEISTDLNLKLSTDLEIQSIIPEIIPSEVWKSLTELGYPYNDISSYGKVRNIRTGKINKSKNRASGYDTVLLYKADGKTSVEYIYILTAKIFVSAPPSDMHKVHHIDKNLSNNHYTNLVWIGPEEQLQNKKPITGRSVNQYDLNGTFIRKWESISEATNSLNLQGNVSMVCRGQIKKCDGYIWKYTDEVETIEGEIWKNIPYPEYNNVQVSNVGRIKHTSGKITYGQKYNDYLAVNLMNKNNKIIKKYHYIHDLMMAAFFGINDNLKINHKNGIRTDNRLENLEYKPVLQKIDNIHKNESVEQHQSIDEVNLSIDEINCYSHIQITPKQINAAEKDGYFWKYENRNTIVIYYESIGFIICDIIRVPKTEFAVNLVLAPFEIFNEKQPTFEVVSASEAVS